MSKAYDHIIIGAGIMGLSVARVIHRLFPRRLILIVEKENDVAAHASGRNSGVLHAGFYYTSNSLKAKFTVAGNRAMKEFCRTRNLPVNECGKLVVAQNEAELKQLYELERRGKANGSNIRLIDAEEASRIEPNVLTFQKALYSPDTASVDPVEVCQAIKDELASAGVDFQFGAKYIRSTDTGIETSAGHFEAKQIINCAGLYAEKIAQDYGFGEKYTIIPFKGLYLKYTKNKTDITTNIYPVPNLKNPFLGVHFTKTVHGDIKIGPTAIPAFWRENYGRLENFSLSELCTIGYYETKLLLTNSFNFRDLAGEEIRKYDRDYFIGLAVKMVKSIDPAGFTVFTKPGIRAQLLDKKTLELVQDFVVEGDAKSLHILNAVSPAFTCAFPFAEHVVQTHIKP